METQQRFRYSDLAPEVGLDIFGLFSVTNDLGNTRVQRFTATCRSIFSEATPRFEYAVKQHVAQQSCNRVHLENCENEAPEGHKLGVLKERVLCDMDIMWTEMCLVRISAKIFEGG